jgi:lipopolysaccharide transport system ATP-binding protein
MSGARDPAVSVTGVSKRYELYDTPQARLKQFILPRVRRALRRPPRQYFREFWALRDISLQVRKGESVGIVGRNGSGKSTLLQIIAGTLFPTAGAAHTHGRVAALLELGSGFNPDFTGRENVFVNGALFGMSNSEVEARMDSIQAFADIGTHFDQPLSTYSSGMQMRVAFAVATAFDPDILIIDEALAVGDAFFQQKCFQRIARFKDNGGTLLFVSHDANIVKQLCDRAVLISDGRLLSEGVPRAVIDLYQGLMARDADASGQQVVVAQAASLDDPDISVGPSAETSKPWPKSTTVTTNNDAVLTDVRLISEGRRVTQIESEQGLILEYRVTLHKHFEQPAFGVIIRDRTGRSVFETSTYAMGIDVPAMANGSRVVVRFSFAFNLRAGHYSFSVGVANKGYARSEFEEYSLLMHDVEQIEVVEAEGAIFYGGVFNMHPSVLVRVAG